MTGTSRVSTRRPTKGIRRGLRMIVDVVSDDFDNAFERLFPAANDEAIADICEAIEWLEQYADTWEQWGE